MRKPAFATSPSTAAAPFSFRIGTAALRAAFADAKAKGAAQKGDRIEFRNGDYSPTGFFGTLLETRRIPGRQLGRLTNSRPGLLPKADAVEVLDEVRVERTLQERYHLVADAVALYRHVAVRRVLAPRDPELLEIRLELRVAAA